MSENHLILGAIAGDVIGSVYEFDNVKTTDFPLFGPKSDFTDDSVLTWATMDLLLNGGDYATVYQDYSRNYPNRGYGGHFKGWIMMEKPRPYYSFGNGAAMRVSPVGWAFDTLDEVLNEAERSASVTHNHPEGIKGAKATAGAVFLARKGQSKTAIKKWVEETTGYDLNRRVDEIRPVYQFNETCQETVPEAIIAFLESDDFEDAIRLGISMGGDSDTLACITGGISEAFYGGVPDDIQQKVLKLLPSEAKELVRRFSEKFFSY
ncbi:MAG: ADP-ribosylglycohydrolase family protein [Marinilabiliaceae bacterium]